MKSNPLYPKTIRKTGLVPVVLLVLFAAMVFRADAQSGNVALRKPMSSSSHMYIMQN